MAETGKMRIGFVGVGTMGHGAAKNIVEKGLLAGIMPGTVVAECSTAMPESTLRIAIRNMHKDLTYFLRMAEALPAHAAMAETARQSVTLARLAGFDEACVPRLYEALCRLNGVEPRD